MFHFRLRLAIANGCYRMCLSRKQ